jgi:hypothetical protein
MLQREALWSLPSVASWMRPRDWTAGGLDAVEAALAELKQDRGRPSRFSRLRASAVDLPTTCAHIREDTSLGALSPDPFTPEKGREVA